MFVVIDNIEMNIPKITEWIIKSRDASGGVISPDFAMEILSKTNHFGHIKMILKNINDKCSDDEKKNYKDFVLACADGREMSQQAMKGLIELADVCCVREEFEKLNKKHKFYKKLDCDKTNIVKSRAEFEALDGDNLNVYFDVDSVCLERADLCKARAIKFRQGASVDLKKATNLPEFLDVSTCSKIALLECDLAPVNELKFRDGAWVYLPKVKNLPKNLDFSKCVHVSLHGCDLEDYKELKFGEGAEVYLSMINGLPRHLDLSMCSKVNLSDCDLSKVDELKFREGASVDFERITGLHGTLDVSRCKNIDLGLCSLKNVDLLKLRDKKQEKEVKQVIERYKGRIVYLDENNSILTTDLER